jgi:mRNA interferase HigB
MVERAAWSSPAQIRATFGSADFLAGNRVVFDIKGNAYRLVAQVKYAPLFLVFVRFLGTHAEYDRIDANKV